jgi:hypothetical protein
MFLHCGLYFHATETYSAVVHHYLYSLIVLLKQTGQTHAQYFSAIHGLRQVSNSSCTDLWKCIESAERLALLHAFVTASEGGLKKLRGMYLMSRGEYPILRYDGLHSGHIVQDCVCRNCVLKRLAQVAILCPELMLHLAALPLEAKDIIAVFLATDV